MSMVTTFNNADLSSQFEHPLYRLLETLICSGRKQVQQACLSYSGVQV